VDNFVHNLINHSINGVIICFITDWLQIKQFTLTEI